ncbi:MAG: hypothetical protein MPJ78_08270 [Hyphomicrobiaceae bacterium]|nr:hypothetical protein [Hyphomicrobiaceae bacterium]
MKIDLDILTEHDMGDDCPVCRTQDLVDAVLLPAAAAWEQRNGLPRLSLALHGAAGLLGALLEEGVRRDELERTLAELLDEIEQQILEDMTMGGPPQGTA